MPRGIALVETTTSLATAATWMRNTSGRNIECAAFHVETGLELRTMYSPREIIASQLFRGPDADEKVAEMADQWRLNLIAKGFEEIA
jgi:hypothetical protein